MCSIRLTLETLSYAWLNAACSDHSGPKRFLLNSDRNLRERGVEGDSVARLIDAIEGAFPDAMVVGFRGLTPLMTCDTKDRHVLAAAAVANHKEPREVHVNDVQG